MSFEIQDYSLFDDIGPEKIICLYNPLVDMKAVVVVDNFSYGTSGGGLRLAPDITVDEMIRLARAMTLKFGSYKIPAGGAKAGIWGDPRDLERKDILLTSFADSAESLIKNYIYYPGPDMGTNDHDLLKIFNIIKMPNIAPKKIGLYKNGVPVEELFTGYGVVYCLETIYHNLEKITPKRIDETKKPRVLLEGFGKVGTALAIRLQELGFKLTGLSTLDGAIFDEDGLDIEKLLNLKSTYGDQLVNHYESKNLIKVPKEKLFELSSEYPIEFIIPGARPDVINKENIDKIDAVSIVPAANIPYERGIIESLNEKNVMAFPDFIVNAGEVLAIYIGKAAKNVDEIFEYIRSNITTKTLEVINGSVAENLSIFDYAVKSALKDIKKKIRRRKNNLEKLNRKYKN
jgi:glutamate dehydrogenase/leucine dehydrogenase